MIGQVLEATEARVVVMEERATEAQIEQVVARLVEMGMDVHRSNGVTRTVLGAAGGRENLPRWRVQAAQLAVQLSRPRRAGTPSAARRGVRREHEARDRGDGRQPDRADRALLRHLSGGRAEHAEFHAASRAWS